MNVFSSQLRRSQISSTSASEKPVNVLQGAQAKNTSERLATSFQTRFSSAPKEFLCCSVKEKEDNKAFIEVLESEKSATLSNLWSISASEVSVNKTSDLSSCSTKNNAKVSVSELKKSDLYEMNFGCSRFVFINSKTGDGYKIARSKEGSYHADFSADEKLNELYESKDFYGGKYRAYALNKIIEIPENPNSSVMIRASYFKKIPNSEQVEEECPCEFQVVISDEMRDFPIPEKAIFALSKAGYDYSYLDLRDLVKVRNECGGWDYLPINGKSLHKLI